MNFSETIENFFLKDLFTTTSLAEILICLGIALVIGIFIYFVYFFKNKSEFYSKEFNLVLICLPIITSAIVFSMQSNLVLSLGMVGALSIVRFRNAVKSSLDLLFLFWAISVGIICGGKLYLLAIVLSAVLTIILIIFDLLPAKHGSSLLVVNLLNNNDTKVNSLLKKYTKYYKIKSKSIHNNNLDLIIEVRGKNLDLLIKECAKIKDVENVNLLSYDGEIRI